MFDSRQSDNPTTLAHIRKHFITSFRNLTSVNGVTLYLNSGNHDQYTRSVTPNSLEDFELYSTDTHKIKVINAVTPIQVDNNTELFFIPYDEDIKGTKEAVNDYLYKHPFNEVLAYIAFTGHSEKISGVVTSPEYTSSGALKKCWSNRADGIYLLKGDDFINYSDGRSQATMEFYAAQIAAIMDLEHIPYDLEEFHHRNGEREIICKCKLFTDENTGYVPAYDFFRDKGLDVSRANLQKILVQDKMAEIYGREKYADLMIFDALICNKDRHLGNFGYLIDNDTGNYLKPAPLFDNGFSLLYGAAKSDMDNLTEYISAITGKYLDFDLAARLFVQPRHIPKIRKLLNFYFIKHPKYNVSDDTLSKMSTFIQLRAKKILELSREKQPID